MTAEGALDFIQEHVRDFREMGPRLNALENEALAVVSHAAAAGDHTKQLAAHELALSIEHLHQQWAWVAKQVEWVVARVPGLGLGAFPAIPFGVVAVAGVLVGWMIYLFAREQMAERLIDAVADGRVTAEEARELGADLSPDPNFVGDLVEQVGGVLKTAVVIGAIGWGAKIYLESRARVA